MKRGNWAWYILIGLTVTTAILVSTEIPFESNPDAYALIPEQERLELEQFQSAFKSDGYPTMAIVLGNKEGWRSYEDFQWMHEATKWWHVDDSLQTLSITNVPFPVQTFLGIKRKNFVPLASEKKFNRWSKRAHLFDDITSKFLSENRKYALLFIPAEGYSETKMTRFQKEFGRDNISLLPLDYYAIETELQSDNQKETLFVAAISFALILMLFFALTGSLRGLLFIFIMIAFSLSLTIHFVYFSGTSFSIHMVAVPCMLIVLSFTDLMHLLYTHHKMRLNAESTAALRLQLGKSLQRPMMLTSLTNMVGFVLFLLLADSSTLRDISIVSIAGVLFAFLTSRFLAIQLLTKERSLLKENTGEKWNRFHLNIIAALRPKRYILLSAAAVVAVLLAIFVFRQSQINHVPYVTEGDHPAFKAANIVSDHFFGDKTAAIHIEFNDSHYLWNDSTLAHLELLENKLAQLFPIKVISSPTVLAKRYHRFQRNGHPGAYSLPVKYDSLLISNSDILGGSSIVKNNKGRARVLFSYADVDLKTSLRKWKELQSFMDRNPPPGYIKTTLSGVAFHNDLTTQRFSKNIIIGLLISILFGALVTLFFTKNLIVFIATLIANSLPLLVALLLMAVMNSNLNPITLFFFTVIMGLCVDDSIYLLLHRDSFSKGSLYPIAITSVVLAVGFSAFLFSGYDWVQPFGWAFLAGIAVAFLFDAFLLALFTDRNRIFDANG